MKKTRLEQLAEGFINFKKMGIQTTFGIYDDEVEMELLDPEMTSNGIYFTKRQIIDAIKNGGTLLVKETNDEGILNIEFLNRDIHFERVSDDVVRIKMYKKDLLELYEFTKECRNEKMAEVKNIQVPN